MRDEDAETGRESCDCGRELEETQNMSSLTWGLELLEDRIADVGRDVARYGSRRAC